MIVALEKFNSKPISLSTDIWFLRCDLAMLACLFLSQ